MTPTTWLFVLLGLLLMLGGTALLVNGSAGAASRLGLASRSVALTVAVLASSAMDLAFGLQAVDRGRGDLAIGNAVGASLLALLPLLGLVALWRPLSITPRRRRLDAPVLAAAALAVYGLAHDGQLGLLDGLILLLGMLAYLLLRLRSQGFPDLPPNRSPARQPPSARWRLPLDGLAMVAGLTLLAGGARLLVDGASALALAYGLSELTIGLTVLAAGTSIPELTIVLLAAWRRQEDIVTGTALGSAIVNLLLVLGLCAVQGNCLSVSPNIIEFDLPALLAATAACLGMMLVGRRLGRPEALLMLGYYAAYALYVLQFATGLGQLETFRTAMLHYVIPLTLLGLPPLLYVRRRSRY